MVQSVKDLTAAVLVAAEAKIRSLAPNSGLRIRHCHSSGVGCGCGSEGLSPLPGNFPNAVDAAIKINKIKRFTREFI